MELLQHSSHEHPLVLIQVYSPKIEEVEEENGSPKSEDEDDSTSEEEEEAAWCYGCGEQVEGPSYCCNSGCKFYLHKSCAELELGLEINPPFHPHPLSFLPKSPYPEGECCFCSFCGDAFLGFVFHCQACDIFLDIKCAFLPLSTIGNFTQLQHPFHRHPLSLFENHKVKLHYCFCDACERLLSDSDAIYRCLDCENFYLHKECAELPLEINHPFHPDHPLFLQPKPQLPGDFQFLCDFCDRKCSGFLYECKPCYFGLDVFCGVFQLSTITKLPKLEHFSHQHSLLLIDKEHNKMFRTSCVACELPTSGTTIYRCLDCVYDLHKNCAELPREINHPFHPPHPLILLTRSPCFETRKGVRVNICRFCHGSFTGFVYRCDSCNLDLDLHCAKLPLCIAGDFHKLQHFSHEHPLIFINEKYNKEDNSRCSGCWKSVLSGSFYRCVDCNSFDLHKECAELPLEINHPYHRKHPLTLLPNPPIHPEKCYCYWCKVQYKGFIYYCSSCKFGLNPENVSLPHMITDASHEHPWILLSVCISFICNFCGADGECAPYVCTICNLVVHKNCISLPQKINITRHHHTISHLYFLQPKQSEKLECRICHDEVNTEYGGYCCFASGCNYIAHVKCATDEANVLEDQDECPRESLSLITDVIEEMTVGEHTIATKIKHAYHEHYLVMTIVGEVKDDSVCDGCMRNISVPFYSCEECGFFLHRHCAELPRVKQVAIHKHRLRLGKYRSYTCCVACSRFHHGFSYTCESCDFKIDIQCSLLSDSQIHPSHEHKLLLTQEYDGNCSGCNNKNKLVYRCKERCEFALCFECITLPPTMWYKLDRHPLSLAYYDNSDQSQLCCDMCEEGRHRNDWFYYCAVCDNSVHTNCVLGDLPFIKFGNLQLFRKHQHIVRFVQKVWNCPPCNVCAKLCNGQALECIESYCNHSFHFNCIND